MNADDLLELLDRLSDYMDNRADACTEDGEWVQNDEMRFCAEILEARATIEAIQLRGDLK